MMARSLSQFAQRRKFACKQALSLRLASPACVGVGPSCNLNLADWSKAGLFIRTDLAVPFAALPEGTTWRIRRGTRSSSPRRMRSHRSACRPTRSAPARRQLHPRTPLNRCGDASIRRCEHRALPDSSRPARERAGLRHFPRDIFAIYAIRAQLLHCGVHRYLLVNVASQEIHLWDLEERTVVQKYVKWPSIVTVNTLCSLSTL
jgi:hypothetical protein